jgi:hypothetical protein
MIIKIISAKDGHWYKDVVGEIFDAELKIHPKFQNNYYQLMNTERNQSYFVDNEFELLFLLSGNMGVEYKDAMKTWEGEI